jgi:4a-hydroxytetrahydrobiopterin dehydratase
MENPVRLKRQEISDAVSDLGWRHTLRDLRTQVRTASLGQAASVAARVAAVAGAGASTADGASAAGGADEHLRMDIRSGHLYLTLQTLALTAVTARDLELAAQIAAAVRELGLRTEPGGDERTVQVTELGIDAMDIEAIRPFWKAVLAYVDEPCTAEAGTADPKGAIVDPAGQGPPIWFQQMDEPRPQRNRIHLDINVPHDEAQGRIDNAIAAGGKLTYTAEAPAFWVFADPEGNEACICTWQARDLVPARSLGRCASRDDPDANAQ